MNAIVIGCGWAGQIHAKTCSDHPGIGLAAVCDPDLEKARRVGDRYNCRAYATLGELLKGEQAQVGLVASPTETHLQVCRQLLEAGIPVLCEKPLSRDSASAGALVAEFAQAGVSLGVNYNRRFASGYALARQRIAAAGQVRFVTSILAQNVPMAQTAAIRARLPADFLVFDALSHQIDLAHFLVGRLKKVSVFGYRETGGRVWTDLQVGIQFESGALGSLICSLAGPEWGQLPIERTEIGTERERILVDNITARVEWFDYREKISQQWTPGIFEATGYEESMRASIGAWLEAMLQNQAPPIPATDGLLAIEWCEQVRNLLQNQE